MRRHPPYVDSFRVWQDAAVQYWHDGPYKGSMANVSPRWYRSAMDSELLSNLQVDTYVKVGCLTLLVYDTLLHLDKEYRFVWKSRWSVIKCLYLWVRYSTYIDTVLAVQERLDFNRDAASCSRIMDFTTIFAGFGIGVAEIILMVRTYAMYERSKRLLCFFVVLWIAVGCVNIWAVLQWTGSFEVAPSPSVGAACYIGTSSNIGLVCYTSLVAGETVIVFLTLWKALHSSFLVGSTYQASKLVVSFYRDGILFYLAVLPFSIVNAVILFVQPPGLNIVADTPLRVMHTILACHLVTHVRSVADEEASGSNHTEPVHSLEFARRPETGQTLDSFV
ncbi:hypothetical protein FB45DRAFT_953010 [Roridomyces roridus]|uniref:DUF6533 domain-containing protein n=1 Tax=Roridomyces roridus TaxID=1738132 RepID=A0AAD7F6P1_9AGAR|nr:hypothetical protein FB45DRAFT_953010 [Roridomyces roridus]